MKTKVITKVFAFLHGKAIQLAATAGTAVTAFLMIKFGISEQSAIMIGTGVAAALGVVIKEAAVWINRKFVVDIQVKEGIVVDGLGGPETRVATDNPKLDTEGHEIIPKAIPVESPKP